MKKISLYIIFITVFISCKKQNDWLDVKSNKSDVIPTSLEDFQALLDNTDVMNTNYPAMGVIGADNSYNLDQTVTAGGTVAERNAYKWASDIYEGELLASDWTYPFQTIEYANVVLEGIEKNKNYVDSKIAIVKGRALFFRAFAYYHLAQLYTRPYNEITAQSDLGLPLKLHADVNNLPDRASIEDTYDQILKDLLEAESLLPSVIDYKTRPSKLASEAMLAKVYFNMQNYSKAKDYADLVLSEKSDLIDFNTLSTTVSYPFPTVRSNNPEILFYAQTTSYTFNSRTELCVMKDLYDSYNVDDLRKNVFYRSNVNGAVNFGGRYTGANVLFCGIAINEILLIRAESYARLGNFNRAIDDLNKLLKERWRKENGISKYVNLNPVSTEQVLPTIINERRKELPFTGNLRWEDLRRLNLGSKYSKTLTRTILGKNFQLEPNSARYTFPIPPIEMNIHSITQNIR